MTIRLDHNISSYNSKTIIPKAKAKKKDEFKDKKMKSFRTTGDTFFSRI